MKKRLLCTLLSISLTLSAGFGLSFSNPASVEAYDTLSNGLSSSSPFTTSTYNHASTFQDMNVYHGIDVSYHNGNINWQSVAADGVEYAFIRAGYRGYGNGSLQQDSKFTTYAADAEQAGIPIGVYYFTEATNVTEAVEEARDCIRMIQENNINVTLPIALDYEYQYNAAGQLVSPKAGLSKAAATANCQAFCDTIAEAGYTPIIYANKSDLTTLIDGAALAENYGIWLANYTTTTTYSSAYQIWQYTDKGTVSGISGKVDCNFWYTQGDLGIATPAKKTYDLKTAVIDAIPAQTYTGKQLKPALSIKLGSKALTAGVHYTASYTNNINPGKATVTITGKGNYIGTLTKTFKIKPGAVTSLTTKTTASKITLTWKGSKAYSGYEIYRSTT
ncbi:MAG: glycoside hydrolase family 25 protein, partial [Lachnospiraceae bacterium]|nr:glycoside hydrolase family 25 protein [Lachnospiraceae bacterium]